MPDTDPASAARRVAEDIRRGRGPGDGDLVTLLPFLDAVAAGPDADRVERYADAIKRTGGCTTDPHVSIVDHRDAACAAIALADAERAAETAKAPQG